MQKGDLDPQKRELAKLIYESTQQSAEHHDTVLWEVTYIIWGATTLLLGFVLEAIRQEALLCLITAILSIFITIMVWRLAMAYVKVRNFKYEICKEIENTLEMPWKQHADLDSHYPKGAQTLWYRVTTVFFIAVWLAVAIRSFCLLWAVTG